MSISLELSNKLRNMSFVCIFLLLLGHSPGWGNKGIINDFVCKFLSAGVYVPVFFMMSGYLFGIKLDCDAWYKHGLITRIRSLAIPFFIFNTLWYPVMYLSHYLGVTYCGAVANAEILDTSVINVLKWLGIIPVVHPALGPLWYIRALFLYVLVSPIYVPVIRKGRGYAYSLLAMIVVCMVAQSHFKVGGLMSFEFNARNLFFFIAGVIVAIYPLKIHMRKIASIICLVLVPTLAIKLQGVLTSSVMTVLLGLLVTCLVSFSLWELMPTNVWPKILTRNVFAIYILHGMVMISASLVLKFLGCWNTYLTAVGKLPNALVTLAVCISVAEGLRKILPNFARIAFGGR